MKIREKTPKWAWLIRALSLALAAAIVVNFYLLFMKRIDPLWFWAIAAFIAGMAYFVIPGLMRKLRGD